MQAPFKDADALKKHLTIIYDAFATGKLVYRSLALQNRFKHPGSAFHGPS
jgi:hypothetical protein